MSVDVYPAHLKGREFHHADDWDDGSTLNMANGNFYAFFTELFGEMIHAAPGYMKTRTVANIMKVTTDDHLREHRYFKKLQQIVARAQILKAQYICYA